MLFQLILDNQRPIVTPIGSGSVATMFGWMVFGVIGFAVVSFAIYRLLRSLHKPELVGISRAYVQKTWAQIEQTGEQGVMGAKVAIMEADKLLDAVLKSMMIPGETMGERLKYVTYKYRGIDRVWPAHKMRNQLVHDSAFQLSTGQARRALAEFKAALKLLNVL